MYPSSCRGMKGHLFVRTKEWTKKFDTNTSQNNFTELRNSMVVTDVTIGQNDSHNVQNTGRRRTSQSDTNEKGVRIDAG
jgi:hypothetical protein